MLFRFKQQEATRQSCWISVRNLVATSGRKICFRGQEVDRILEREGIRCPNPGLFRTGHRVAADVVDTSGQIGRNGVGQYSLDTGTSVTIVPGRK